MRELKPTEVDKVYGGGDYCEPPPEDEKGNNGWGNGEDPTNPGSFAGATAASKSANGSVPAAGRINTNPTSSNGR